jgi:hypothetical protein
MLLTKPSNSLLEISDQVIEEEVTIEDLTILMAP